MLYLISVCFTLSNILSRWSSQGVGRRQGSGRHALAVLGDAFAAARRRPRRGEPAPPRAELAARSANLKKKEIFKEMKGNERKKKGIQRKSSRQQDAFLRF